MKSTIKQFVPPVLVESARRLKGKVNPEHGIEEWEYVPEGWEAAETNPKIKGWNVASVLEAYKTNWPSFLETLKDVSPLGISPDSDPKARTNLSLHNILMTFGYVFALASRNRSSISMLDWGGGIGHYYLLARTFVPGVEIEYHGKDVPLLAEYGRELFPQAHFYTDDSCLRRQYDFVLASTSLHYSRDWPDTLAQLARATAGSMLVAQLPVVRQADSFVMVQRPYSYGYDTEYLGWCLNRDEFLERAKQADLRLIREFITGHQPIIQGAPEQCEYRSFFLTPSLLTDD